MIYSRLPRYTADGISKLLMGAKLHRNDTISIIYEQHREYFRTFYAILLGYLYSSDREDAHFRQLFLKVIGTHTHIRSSKPRYFALSILENIRAEYSFLELECEFYNLYHKVANKYFSKYSPKAQPITYIVKFLMYAIRDWIVSYTLKLRKKKLRVEFEEPTIEHDFSGCSTINIFNDWLFNLGYGHFDFNEKTLILGCINKENTLPNNLKVKLKELYESKTIE